MAPISYYYSFSIITLLGISTWLINLIYVRLRSRTIFGRSYTVGTPVYRRVMKVASGRNILISLVVTLFTLANFIWSLITVLEVKTSSAHLLLLVAPIVLLSIWIFMMVKLSKDYGARGPSKRERDNTLRKHSKDDDSWLS